MDHLRRAFRDIAAGYTRATILGRPAYIRHLSHADQVDIDQLREDFLNEAKAQGIPTDEERLAQLVAEGKWTDGHARDLARAKSYIAELEEGKRKNANMPSMVAGYVQRIDEARKDYEAKALVKRQLLGLTCEVHADMEVNEHYIVANVFEDAAMTRSLFANGECDLAYMSDAKVTAVVQDYNAAIEGCSDKNLRRLAMQGFFQRYFQLVGDDLMAFFGRPVCALTFYQVDLLRHGSHFRHIYTTHDVSQFPKNVLEDPDLLTDYAVATTKGKQDLTQAGAFEQGAMVVGMKAEDAKVLGVKATNPLEELKKHGGNFMEMVAAKQRGG